MRRHAMYVWLLALLAVVGRVGAAAEPGETGGGEGDDGYFLSLKQKGQLIGTGRIEDAAGAWYDIWIVPGYVAPARHARKFYGEAGSDFAEYVQGEKYASLVEHSGDALEWAYDDCLYDFTIKGVPRAWGRYWSRARARTQQRVFGWWFAYPWALTEGIVDNVLRVPVGLAGTALGTAWGVAVVPGYYAVNSTVAGAWHGAVDGTLVPAVGCAWNTIIAPPMALAGQKPSPARADGFWVRRMTGEEEMLASRQDEPIRADEVDALAEWGRGLLSATQPFEERRRELMEQKRAEYAAVDSRFQKAEDDLRAEEQAAVYGSATNGATAEVVERLRQGGFDRRRTTEAAAAVRRRLVKEEGLAPADANRIQGLLSRYPPLMGGQASPARPKTDPVQNSLQVIDGME